MKKIIRVIGYIFGGLFLLGVLAAIFEKKEPTQKTQQTQQMEEKEQPKEQDQTQETNKIDTNKFMDNGLKLIIAEVFYNIKDRDSDISNLLGFNKIDIYSNATILKDYQNNEIKADKKYLDKRFFITGKVNSIQRDAFNNRSISLNGGVAIMSSSNYGDGYYRRLKNNEVAYLNYLAELKTGQNILLSCKVSGLVIGMVSYSDCVPAFAALPYNEYYQIIKEKANQKEPMSSLLKLVNNKINICNISNPNEWTSLKEENQNNQECIKKQLENPEIIEELKNKLENPEIIE